MRRTNIVTIALLFIAAISMWACSEGTKEGVREVRNGDIIQVNYTGKLQDGTMFDTSVGRGVFEFAVGKHQVIDGFENGVIGMRVGQKKVVNIPAAQAYGPYRPELVYTILKKDLKSGVKPEVGMVLNSVDDKGNPIYLLVTKVEGDTITVDANNRLAGKDLIFEIELVKIL